VKFWYRIVLQLSFRRTINWSVSAVLQYIRWYQEWWRAGDLWGTHSERWVWL